MAQHVHKKIRIDGMTCVQCETIISKKLRGVPGIYQLEVHYSSGILQLTYDPELISLDAVQLIIEQAGYSVVREKSVSPPSLGMIAGVVILGALYVYIDHQGGFRFIPEFTPSMSYGMLFLAGLLTSLHCVAMCGGINISQCLPKPSVQIDVNLGQSQTKSQLFASSIKPSLLYNSGRVISYTVIGALVGGLGSVLSLNGSGKGLIAIVAGILMMVMGINLLGIFPGLRRFSLFMPKPIRSALMGKNGDRGPLMVGLVNGFMPCGPLQAMQIYALGTGSALVGGLSMFFFSLGTVPLMFLLGSLSTQLGKNFTKRLTQMGAVVVIFLGLVMAERGFALSGIATPTLMDFLPQRQQQNAASGSLSGGVGETDLVANSNGTVQVIETPLEPNRYPNLVVQKGIPVSFNLIASSENINGCNGSLEIAAFGVKKDLKPGDNVIEFTPTEAGTYSYSCWMGMINAQITVVEDLETLK